DVSVSGGALSGRLHDDAGSHRIRGALLDRRAAQGAATGESAAAVHRWISSSQAGSAFMTTAIAIAAGAGLILVYAGLMLLVVPTSRLQGASQPEGFEGHTETEIRGRELYISLGCVYCHSQQPRDPSQTRADQEFGWGRPSVPADYTYQGPHLLGTMRTGPDLFNIGARQPSVDWQLAHLYNPRAVVSWSTMPSY